MASDFGMQESPSLRVLWRGKKVTRIEGVLRVNLLAPVVVLRRREAGHKCTFDTIKLDIARDPVLLFRRNPHNFEAFLIADLSITTRGPRKFVLDNSRWVQGPAWKTIFGVRS